MKSFHADVEQLSKENTNFRKVIHTSQHCQLVLMSLLPGEEIGTEIHPDNDQFFRCDAGSGMCVIDGQEYAVEDGTAIIIPAGAEHNVTNTSDSEDLKLYTIYCPPHHKDGIVRATRAEAMDNEEDFDGVYSS